MKRILFFLGIIVMMSGCVSAVTVDPHHRPKVKVVKTTVKRVPSKHTTVVVKNIVVGTRVRTLPAKYVVINYNNSPFVYAEGVFYRRLPSAEYEVIRPQIGMIVPLLPKHNVKKVRVKGEKLFLFDGVLFKKIRTSHGVQYRVVGFN